MTVMSARATGTTTPLSDDRTGVRTADVSGELPWVEDAGKIAPQDARALSKIFFDRLQVLEEGTHEHQYARNTLIEMNLSLVRFAASRFRNRGGDDTEDIIQVGTIGLIKAIDRFDLSREVEFATFAVPYIVGEIKRFFRDTTWSVHVPRRLQELRVDLAKAKEQLSAQLDRDPTVKELAAHLDLPEEEIIEGLVAANGFGGFPRHPVRGQRLRPGAAGVRRCPRRAGPGHGDRREPAHAGPAAGAARRPGAPDRADAVRGGDDAVADRRGAGCVPDAVVAAAQQDRPAVAQGYERRGLSPRQPFGLRTDFSRPPFRAGGFVPSARGQGPPPGCVPLAYAS
ncbi:RNA polymerase sigma factor RpoD [Streptomyces badius]